MGVIKITLYLHKIFFFAREYVRVRERERSDRMYTVTSWISHIRMCAYRVRSYSLNSVAATLARKRSIEIKS